MEDKTLRELKTIVGDQFSEVISNIMVRNILHYISICKRHNIDESKLNLALQQYINEAKVDGIKVPKSKGSKHSGTNVLVRDPMSYINKPTDNDVVNKLTGVSKTPNVDMSVSYPYGNTRYYVTDDIVGEGLVLCVDTDMRALLAWNVNKEEEVRFDTYDRRWLLDNGYKISPYM